MVTFLVSGVVGAALFVFSLTFGYIDLHETLAWMGVPEKHLIAASWCVVGFVGVASGFLGLTFF